MAALPFSSPECRYQCCGCTVAVSPQVPLDSVRLVITGTALRAGEPHRRVQRDRPVRLYNNLVGWKARDLSDCQYSLDDCAGYTLRISKSGPEVNCRLLPARADNTIRGMKLPVYV